MTTEDTLGLKGHAIVTWYKWDNDINRYIQIEKTRVVKLPQSGDGWTHYGSTAPR